MESAEHIILIGDSIVKYIKDWTQMVNGKTRQVKVNCIRGCTYKKLYKKIKDNEINIAPYKDIILHIGTNDLNTYNNSAVNFYFVQLIDEIRSKNSTASIIVSTPIPRPKDHHMSHKDIGKFINWITKNRKQGKYLVWRSDKTFLYPRSGAGCIPKIKDHGFYHRDGLHITQTGSDRLEQQIRMAISHMC